MDAFVKYRKFDPLSFADPLGTRFRSDNAMAVVGTRHNNLVTRDSLARLHTPYVFLSITCTHPPRCPDGVDRTSRVDSASWLGGERERGEG
ncbi:hypothetical protein HZH66_009648 [Vespula vulgaris]|uniref:Uncharacterized protein n=1 Tax=Vespula vulgaris TaxID=7454 RepID=A0A834JLP4_VESVU|nr:hypothetical protein HZH66_009648 [Vespula vulgaris]